jgi:hypothetical protein
MAEGQGVDVLEDGVGAEERPGELDQMRQIWRAEAEKAAEYFSAIPGFGNPTLGQPTEVPVRPAVQPGPSSPEDEGKPSRRGFLVGLRQRLGKRPHNRQAPLEQPVAEEPVAAEEPRPRSSRFHTSF